MPHRPPYLFQLTPKGREKVRLNQFYGQATPTYTGICEAVLRLLDQGPLDAYRVYIRLKDIPEKKYSFSKVFATIYSQIQMGNVEKVGKHINPLNIHRYNVSGSSTVLPPPAESG